MRVDRPVLLQNSFPLFPLFSSSREQNLTYWLLDIVGDFFIRFWCSSIVIEYPACIYFRLYGHY